MKNATLDDFPIGTLVNVKYLEGDLFDSFTGRVVGFQEEDVVVEDRDGYCWNCKPTQLSFSSDDIMHGEA